MRERMKILMLTPYIYDHAYQEFSRNRTGFGMMVRDIFHQMLKTEDAYLLSHVFTRGHDHILKNSVLRIICSASFADWKDSFKAIFRKHSCFGEKVRDAVYCLEKGMVRKTILRLQPDIVHVHGLGVGTYNYIEVCKKLNISFVVTAHGLLKQDSAASFLDRKIEKETFSWLNENNISFSVISTGMKRKLLSDSYYGLKNEELIAVVPNGVDTSICYGNISIREKYHIPKNSKIILTVGSVYEHKNQLQIVYSFAKLISNTDKNLFLFIVGSIAPDYPIQEEIDRLGLQSNVILTGFVPHDQLSNYYSEASLVVMASKDEGFGLSLVESFVYGIPSVTFSDLDAVEDIYNTNAMLICNERTDVALSEAISAALEKKWDAEWIKEYSHKFSIEYMGSQYLSLYQQIIQSENELK